MHKYTVVTPLLPRINLMDIENQLVFTAGYWRRVIYIDHVEKKRSPYSYTRHEVHGRIYNHIISSPHVVSAMPSTNEMRSWNEWNAGNYKLCLNVNVPCPFPNNDTVPTPRIDPDEVYMGAFINSYGNESHLHLIKNSNPMCSRRLVDDSIAHYLEPVPIYHGIDGSDEARSRQMCATCYRRLLGWSWPIH